MVQSICEKKLPPPHQKTTPLTFKVGLTAFGKLQEFNRVPKGQRKNSVKIVFGPNRLALLMAFGARSSIEFFIKMPESETIHALSVKIQSLRYVQPNNNHQFYFELDQSIFGTLYNRGKYDTENQQGMYKWCE